MKKIDSNAAIAKLRMMDKPFVTPTELAPALGCNPYSINRQVAVDPSALGFPVSKIGTNVRIPREAFLKWFDGLQQ